MSREGALWIGGLEPYMDEEFLRLSLASIGEDNVVSIKVMRNKFTGEPASYGFINFDNDHNALIAMHKLNGKVVPNTNPPVRFKLNHQSTRLMPGERDFSIWVGDLTPDVDDLTLYKYFSARFTSIRTAKVVLDNTGFSKGYGFIRFGSEKEQQMAMGSMMGATGLGTKPIRVSVAVAKNKTGAFPSSIEPSTASAIASMVTGGKSSAANAAAAAAAGSTSRGDYSQYWQQCGQYWSQYAAWNQYSQQPPNQPPPPQQYPYNYDYRQGQTPINQPPPLPSSSATSQSSKPVTNESDSAAPAKDDGQKKTYGCKKSIFEGENTDLVDHIHDVDMDLANNHFFACGEELWDAIESSQWWHPSNNPDNLVAVNGDS